MAASWTSDCVENVLPFSSTAAPTPSVVPEATCGAASAKLCRLAEASTSRSPPPVSVSVAPFPMNALLVPSVCVTANAPERPAEVTPAPETECDSSVCTPSPELAVKTWISCATAVPVIAAVIVIPCMLKASAAATPPTFVTVSAVAFAFESTSPVALTSRRLPVAVTFPETLAVALLVARLTPIPAALPEAVVPKAPRWGLSVMGVGAEPKMRFARFWRKAISPATIVAALVPLVSAPAAPAIPSAWFCASTSAATVMFPAAVTVPATVAAAVSVAMFRPIGVARAWAARVATSARARTMFVA